MRVPRYKVLRDPCCPWWYLLHIYRGKVEWDLFVTQGYPCPEHSVARLCEVWGSDIAQEMDEPYVPDRNGD